MSKRVTFTRKEITDYVEKTLKNGEVKTRELQHGDGLDGLYGAAAFEAGYYHQALITIKTFLEARYEV